jgi:hypothetical protein
MLNAYTLIFVGIGCIHTYSLSIQTLIYNIFCTTFCSASSFASKTRSTVIVGSQLGNVHSSLVDYVKTK